MDNSINNYSNQASNLNARIAQFIFIVLIFAIFFGTSLPFKEKTREVEELTSTNVVNQIIYIFLFITSFVLLIPKYQQLSKIILREKFLILFVGWCLLSIGWSDYSFVSFKRLFQVITSIMVFLAVLIYNDNPRLIIQILVYLFAAYVLISILSILTIPGAKYRAEGVWRGIAPSKNLLGQVALICIIFFTNVLKDKDNLAKVILSFFLVLSLILLVGSRSVTSYLVLIILFLITILFYLDDVFRPIRIGRIFSSISIIFFIIFFVILVVGGSDIFVDIFGSFGKDLTFTGRTDLWADIFNEAINHFLIGCGFRSYWVLESPALLKLYEIYIWLPNQAHNGFIDVLNELGIIGFLLFFLVISNYFYNLRLVDKNHFWKWFVIAVLFVNITESTFIEPKSPTGMMLIFSYLILFVEIVRHEETKIKKLNPFFRGTYL